MIQAPKGTHDVYGKDMHLWRYIEDNIRAITQAYGYTEIRTPIIEHTELFLRGVGDTTDIVQKEMYTFQDKGNRSITLRPEQTAGAARAYVERGMHNQPQPTRLFYIGPNFRYEKPQSGRFRQHNQFGVEVFGAYTPATEAEIISLGHMLISRLGVEDVVLHINSIGCTDCRAVYHMQLKDFLANKLDMLCGTCQERFDKNPLRILDCKIDNCKALLTDAPTVLDALDDECRTHFEQLQALLTRMCIPYIIDPKVVRGLDYYSRTVFEFIAPGYTVIGGGRYDGLISQVGGQATGGVGFGMGIERLVLHLVKQGKAPEIDFGPAIFIGHIGENGAAKAHELAYTLRLADIQAESDIIGRNSVKAQMKYANKVQARYTTVLGCDELAKSESAVKNMQTGEQQTVKFEELREFLL